MCKERVKKELREVRKSMWKVKFEISEVKQEWKKGQRRENVIVKRDENKNKS